MLPKTMKALYSEKNGENCYVLTERPVPTPGPGELLIEVGACGICHTDIIIRSGQAHHPKWPFIPGHEFAGTIAAVGPGVTNHKIGERGGVMQVVTCHECQNCLKNRSVWLCDHSVEIGSARDGAFAKYCRIPATNFVPIPDCMSFEEAAMVEPLANAVFTVEMGRIEHGDRVVVIGPGPIGILAAKVAEFYDPRTVVLVGTRNGRLELARDGFGIQNTININDAGAEQRLMEELLEGRGADVVLEASGSLSGLQLAMRIHNDGARIAMEGTQNKDDAVPVNRLLMRDCTEIINITTWRYIDYIQAMRYVSDGKINIKPLMTQQFPLCEWENGFDYVTNRKSECLKVIINP